MRVSLLILMWYFISCNNEASAPLHTEDSAKPDGTEQNDTVPVVLSDSAKANEARAAAIPAIKLPEGFYRAELPCDNCPGIEHTVFFKRNKTYRSEEVTKGDSVTTVRTSGNFNPSGNTIWAYKEQIVKARYAWGGDTLYYLLPKGKRTAMQKLTSATENEVWRKKGQEGITFFGVGNEPFWNLEINRQKHISFRLAEWPQPLQFDSVTLRSSPDSLVFTAAADTASLKAVIYNRFCSDGMSDYIYTHSMRVDYKGKIFTGCGIVF